MRKLSTTFDRVAHFSCALRLGMQVLKKSERHVGCRWSISYRKTGVDPMKELRRLELPYQLPQGRK